MEETTSVENCITHGPWVGNSVPHANVWKKWIFIPQGFIKKISISYGEVIDGVEFGSDCSKDATQTSLFGAKSGNRTDTICLVYPKEYLTSIRGTAGYMGGYGNVVTSLCFGTNKNRYGNDDKGARFSYDGKDGVIVGFHGRATGRYIEAIGIYVMPKSLALDRNHTCEEHSRLQKCSRLSRLEIPKEVGPWGASGGKTWDDGVFSDVKQVRVHVGVISKVIHAIQIEYVKKDGKSISSSSHGDTDGDDYKIEEVNLDWKNEYLTGIFGFYGPVEESNGLEGIKCITFLTNKKLYGPYGQKGGDGCIYFTSTSYLGKVVGFHGRNGDFLTAIGVHMEYF